MIKIRDADPAKPKARTKKSNHMPWLEFAPTTGKNHPGCRSNPCSGNLQEE
jgi:hypothetical protein